MNGIDTFLDINNAHLRVNSGNVQASTFVLDQINIVTSANTATTVNFNNVTKAFNAVSNIEVGTANLFVDTTTSKVGIGTDAPAYTLDVHGSANVGALTATTFSGSGAGLNSIPSSAISGTLSQWIDINTNDIHYSAGNVGIGKTPDSGKKLDVDGTVKATTFEGEGSALTALNATNIASGTLDVARVPNLNTSILTAGTLPVSRGGTGTTSSTGTGAFVLQNAPAFTGDATFDTNTLKIDAINNRVGVGTVSPDHKLHVDGNAFLSSGNSIRLGTGITDNNTAGIAWNAQHASYFIKRGAGSWTSPDYTQLHMYWPTGIVLDPGNETYGKSRVTVIGHTRCTNSYTAPTGYVQMNHNGSVFRNYTSGGNNYGAGLHLTDGALIPADKDGGNHTGSYTTLGHYLYRWGQIYSSSSSISTSDRNEKQDINEITESERKVASKIVDLFRTFRMKDAVSKKGDEARLHNGVIAQDLIEVFQSEGLDAHRYGLFCYDDIWLVDGENELYETVYEKDGCRNYMNPDGTEREYTPEDEGVKEVKVKTGVFADKDTPGAVATPGPYSIRYEELLCFVVSGELQNERIKYSALEARIAALENA